MNKDISGGFRYEALPASKQASKQAGKQAGRQNVGFGVLSLPEVVAVLEFVA